MAGLFSLPKLPNATPPSVGPAYVTGQSMSAPPVEIAILTGHLPPNYHTSIMPLTPIPSTGVGYTVDTQLQYEGAFKVTYSTLNTLNEISRQWAATHPNRPFVIFDARDTTIVMWPIRKDGLKWPAATYQIEYDRDLTAELIAICFRQSNIRRILHNDASIPGVQPYGCDINQKYVHVEMKM